MKISYSSSFKIRRIVGKYGVRVLLTAENVFNTVRGLQYI